MAKLEAEKDEGFLFGKFGIVDAFFWPVLWVSDGALPPLVSRHLKDLLQQATKRLR